LRIESAVYVRGGRRDLIAITMWFAPLCVLGVLSWILACVLLQGIDHLTWSFLTDVPRRSGRSGGICPILVSTFLILLVCVTSALPLAFGTAVLLSEFAPRQSGAVRLVRLSLDALAGIPSIVIGIFGNAFFCVFLGFGFSILSGGLTLACMILPILIRTTEDSFRTIPNSYRLGGAALGFSKTRVITKILLPLALPGILVGTVLGVGRALAETAALIFTSGYVDRVPTSLFDSGRSLSIHIFDLSMNISGADAAAYRTAVVLIGLILLINGGVGCLAKMWKRWAGLSPV
jgi:phosphate transport system permease protein